MVLGMALCLGTGGLGRIGLFSGMGMGMGMGMEMAWPNREMILWIRIRSLLCLQHELHGSIGNFGTIRLNCGNFHQHAEPQLLVEFRSGWGWRWG